MPENWLHFALLATTAPGRKDLRFFEGRALVRRAAPRIEYALQAQEATSRIGNATRSRARSEAQGQPFDLARPTAVSDDGTVAPSIRRLVDLHRIKLGTMTDRDENGIPHGIAEREAGGVISTDARVQRKDPEGTGACAPLRITRELATAKVGP